MKDYTGENTLTWQASFHSEWLTERGWEIWVVSNFHYLGGQYNLSSFWELIITKFQINFNWRLVLFILVILFHVSSQASSRLYWKFHSRSVSLVLERIISLSMKLTQLYFSFEWLVSKIFFNPICSLQYLHVLLKTNI